MQTQATFSAADGWIDAAFQEMEAWPWTIDRDETTSGVALMFLGLVMHGSLNGPKEFLENFAKLRCNASSGALMPRLVSISEARSLSGLLKEICSVTAFEAKIRSQGIRITGRDVFSQGFLPPNASRARLATLRLFEQRRSGPLGRRSLGFALASYLVLLTIHPLADGNGRTARAMFAADCAVAGLGFWPVLGLLLMRQERGRLFHLAARCARQGDFTMFASCYEQAEQQARRYFGACLEGLCALEDGDQFHPLALTLRERLALLLANGPSMAT